MLRHSFEKNYVTLNKVLVFKKTLTHNLKLFKKLLPGQSICPVLKSNAYGHDLVLTAKILEPERPDFFIVDSLYEAYELREADIHSPILIMGYTMPQNLKNRHEDFHFAAFDIENAKILAKLRAPVHLKIETGLSRMGFTLEDLAKDLKKMKKMKLNVVGIFSHLADADNASSDAYTQEQLSIFKKALALVRSGGFNPKWIHIAASGGALKAQLPEANMVRLGLSLFGINPYSPNDACHKKLKDLKPSLELVSTLTAIRTVKKGQKVGYAGAFIAPEKMQIGVVPTGYYEALPRNLGGKGYVQIRKKLCPILGRVCMNYVIVDLRKVKAKKHDPVIIYSRDAKKPNSIENIAKTTGTIPNELLVRICESLLREVI